MRPSYENNPSEIIDKLLEHHDIKTLRAILNTKARRKDPKGNNYLKIASDVYCLQHEEDSKLEWAIDQIAEQANISDKTIKNHITKFRNEVKEKINELSKDSDYTIEEEDTVKNFIKAYMKYIFNQYGRYTMNFSYSNYKELFDDAFDLYKKEKSNIIPF